MKKTLFAMLLLAGVAAMTVGAAYSVTFDEQIVKPFPVSVLKGNALGTSAITYDTTWIGSSATHAPGAGNWWNIWASPTQRPGTGDPANTIWDFDNFASSHGDSLMGWTPFTERHTTRLAGLNNDLGYVWSCADFGNQTSNKNVGPTLRATGVIGAWHSDPGAAAGKGVFWTPMAGLRSAWCGLRVHGDESVMCPETNNPYNSDGASWIGRFQGPLCTSGFPGYVGQWDQMMYRDITPVTNQDLSLSFLYRTFMSTAFSTGQGRCGWFHGDPLSTIPGNFISSFTQLGPIDSFTVYIGVPVNDAAVTLSSGAVAPVYDTQRRWFSEVLRIWDGPTAPYFEILGKTGRNPVAPDTSGAALFAAVIPWIPAAPGDANIRDIATSPLNSGGKVRLVFRVKTNNTGDDLIGSVSLGGRGAAQIDDVIIQWGAGASVNIGNFEGAEGTANAVNNAVGASSTSFWKSTSRPPALLMHARPLAGLTWLDPCGPPGSPTRTSNMQGGVLDAGNNPTEMIGDNTYLAGTNSNYGLISPAINLAQSGTSLLNNQGLDSTKAFGSDEYLVQYDLYTGALLGDLGCFWIIGYQCYPNTNLNGYEDWGGVGIAFINSANNLGSFRFENTMKADGLVATSLTSGKPDSVKIVAGVYNYPLRFGVTTGANPTDGAYFDNITMAITNTVGLPNPLGTINSAIWHQLADAFPSATTVTLGGLTATSADLDTCGALIKSAYNLAAAGGGIVPRNDILGDSIVVTAGDLTLPAGDPNPPEIRMDFVFRILPGVGNYRHNLGDVPRHYPPTAGMALLRRPDNQTTLVNTADLADHSFWATYIRNPGPFSSPSPHPGNQWSNLTWNSARMDTADCLTASLVNGVGPKVLGTPVSPGIWANTLHEDDPNYAVLGISHPRCFKIDTTAAAGNGDANTICGAAPAWLFPEIPGTTPPRERTGWDGTVTTIEGTKIIPDGLLTPGAHVQFFMRKSQLATGYGGFIMSPDTSTISPQAWGSFDASRYMTVAILPDRWKDGAFGGAGMGGMLFLDYNDRRGDDQVWTSVMDSTGGTTSLKYGAADGWHKAGDGKSLNADRNPTLQADAFVYKNGQSGTLYDTYNVRCPESGNAGGTRIGARFAAKGAGALDKKDNMVCPTPAMLKQFYSVLVVLTGDINTTILGPFLDCPEDDLTMLSDFWHSEGAGFTPLPRTIMPWGQQFVTAESADPAHAGWLSTELGVQLVNANYGPLASNKGFCSDISSTSVISATDIFGVALGCNSLNEVISANLLAPGASPVSQYANTGAGPYYAAVHHQQNSLDPAQNYISLVNGWDIANMTGRFCATSFGRGAYINDMKAKIFGAAAAAWAVPGGGVDVPQTTAGIANSMRIVNNVGRASNARIQFSVAAPGRVRVRLYDVTGRLVRSLADRTFPASASNSLTWDGRDNSGNQAARGVYFARIDYASGTAINGRVVVLQ